MAFYPYLMFGGNCREAFSRYQEIFGGELSLLTMGDLPAEGQPEGAMPAEQADLIMHAALKFDGHLLMASDDATTDAFGPVQGMAVNYTTTDAADAERVFAALAEGGQVTMEIAETFWSPRFGMCTDRFGTPWMVDTEPAANGVTVR